MSTSKNDKFSLLFGASIQDTDIPSMEAFKEGRAILNRLEERNKNTTSKQSKPKPQPLNIVKLLSFLRREVK